jgi:hypothetical protein
MLFNKEHLTLSYKLKINPTQQKKPTRQLEDTFVNRWNLYFHYLDSPQKIDVDYLVSKINNQLQSWFCKRYKTLTPLKTFN